MRAFLNRKKHVRIVPKSDILHERDRYEKGKVYRVDIALARYFERNGWIEGSIAAPPPQTLDIDNSVLGHEGGPK